MTQLLLKLLQPWAHGHLEAGALATVRLVADSNGNIAKEARYKEEKAVPTEGGGAPVSPTIFDLPGAGYYEVEINRPRGQDISREFFVKDGEVRTETIHMEGSPHEYLGWQQFAGIVNLSQSRGQEAFARSFDVVHSAPTVHAADVPESEAAWQLAEEAARGRNRGWASFTPLPWNSQHDADFFAWFPPMPQPGEGIELIRRLKSPVVQRDELQQRFPRWLSFQVDSQIDLVSVPWAWWGARRETDEEIRFVYDRLNPGCTDRHSPGHATIIVQDRRWFGLLEFLASGHLSSAGKLMDAVLPTEEPDNLYQDQATAALNGKVKGPLVAVAGGLLLLARADSTEPAYWDPWLENLSHWFPGIPDGAILLGCRRTQQAKNLEDLTNAYGHLRDGMRRGIPFFSTSIRLLSIALAQIGDDIPEADRDRRAIASVSTRVDPNQPFTVIRL